MQICRIFLQGSETIVALNLEELDQPNLYRRVTIFFKDNSSYFFAASREPMYCIFGPLGLLYQGFQLTKAQSVETIKILGQKSFSHMAKSGKLLSLSIRGILLVGAFSLKEKSPTITVGSFFSFSAYNLTLNGPLFTICSSVLLFIFD